MSAHPSRRANSEAFDLVVVGYSVSDSGEGEALHERIR